MRRYRRFADICAVVALIVVAGTLALRLPLFEAESSLAATCGVALACVCYLLFRFGGPLVVGVVAAVGPAIQPYEPDRIAAVRASGAVLYVGAAGGYAGSAYSRQRRGLDMGPAIEVEVRPGGVIVAPRSLPAWAGLQCESAVLSSEITSVLDFPGSGIWAAPGVVFHHSARWPRSPIALEARDRGLIDAVFAMAPPATVERYAPRPWPKDEPLGPPGL